MTALVAKLPSWDLDSWESDVPEVPSLAPVKLQQWNLEHWDDEVPETSTNSPITVEEVNVPEEKTVIVSVSVPSVTYKNRYEYLIPSIKTTVLKTMFPGSAHPVRDLKETMSKGRLEEYILCVRNEYLLPVYYVLRSTRFFQPIAKKMVTRSKKEYVDPNFKWVSLEDQRKVYKLFGFSGTSQSNDDMLRDEIQEHLKAVLFEPTQLRAIISYLMRCMEITVDEGDIQEICQKLEKGHKAYKLPEKWFHDSTWKPVKYGPIIMGDCGGRGFVDEFIKNF